MNRVPNYAYAAMFVFVCSMHPGYAQELTAKFTKTLSTPVTQDLSESAKAVCSANIKKEVLRYFSDKQSIRIDTTNVITRYFFEIFFARCQPKIKHLSSFAGKDWTYSFSLPVSMLCATMDEHNANYDSLALKNYRLLSDLVARKKHFEAYTIALKAYYYNAAHIGKPIVNPLGITGTLLQDDVRTLSQPLFDRTTIASSDYILTGKSGNPVDNEVTITVRFDSIPFVGLQIMGILSDGRKVFHGTTNEHGQISLKGMTMPFTTRGAILSIQPDVGSLLGADIVVAMGKLGIVSSQQEPSLICKTIPPTFKLNYLVTSINQLKIPDNFSSSTIMNRFFIDSCQFQTAVSGTEPDLMLTVQCQVSRYINDDVQTARFKMEAEVSIVQTNKNDQGPHHESVSFQKTYDTTQEIFESFFYWDATNQLKLGIKKILGSL